METIPPQNKKNKLKRIVQLLLKIALTVICFWYISTKIDFQDTWNALLKANWGWLLLAVFFYSLSKFISALRLNINFQSIKVYLSQWENLKLYWLGMFYNLFLPGAISGDAYKVIILNKSYGAPYKKTSAAVLIDRFSGLLGLGVLLTVYGVFVLGSYLQYLTLIAGTILSILVLYFLIRSLFKDFLQGFFSTFLLGIVVQAMQVICIYSIMKSIDIDISETEWVFIFLVSSAVSVLPISLGGGLGTRELIFAEGARFFHLKPELGIVISLLFYLSNLISSSIGGYYVFRSPFKKNHSS